MPKLCTCRGHEPFRGRSRDAGTLTLLTTCKDVMVVVEGDNPTGLTVTWKPGGWTLHDQQGRPLAEGGIDGRGGFSARHTDGGRVLRDADQFELIGKVAARYVGTSARGKAA